MARKNKLPLYKDIKQRITKGTFEAVNWDAGDNCIKISEHKVGSKWQFADRVCDNFYNIADARYMALAANNLHILAEALGQFIHSVESEGVIFGRVTDAVRNAKEALKSIS